jgi:hypothetical protein
LQPNLITIPHGKVTGFGSVGQSANPVSEFDNFIQMRSECSQE